jgi:3-hydroxybutyryl-CoA dehydrogenase
MNISSFCICGAGTMGSGIAQVAASAGYPVVLFDLNENVLETAKKSVKKSLGVLVTKGKITGTEQDEIFSRIKFTTDIRDCVADLVIEAIIEKLEIKSYLFRDLAKQNAETTIFTSNTSSLSISALANSIPSPERFAGLHFFNPAPVMKLVEVVKGQNTSEEVIAALVGLTKKLGKTPVVCTDAPGFVVNRVARPFYIESLRLAEEGVSMETIDKLLEARGFKMGPFKLMDLIGNDVNYAVSCSVYEQMNNPERLRPSYIQKQKLEKGELGRKTGKGYFEYNI